MLLEGSSDWGSKEEELPTPGGLIQTREEGMPGGTLGILEVGRSSELKEMYQRAWNWEA